MLRKSRFPYYNLRRGCVSPESVAFWYRKGRKADFPCTGESRGSSLPSVSGSNSVKSSAWICTVKEQPKDAQCMQPQQTKSHLARRGFSCPTTCDLLPTPFLPHLLRQNTMTQGRMAALCSAEGQPLHCCSHIWDAHARPKRYDINRHRPSAAPIARLDLQQHNNDKLHREITRSASCVLGNVVKVTCFQLKHLFPSVNQRLALLDWIQLELTSVAHRKKISEQPVLEKQILSVVSHKL